MAGNREYSEEKLKELILYIAQKSEDDPNFDEEKLKAILFESDFRAYKDLGKSITYYTEGK